VKYTEPQFVLSNPPVLDRKHHLHQCRHATVVKPFGSQKCGGGFIGNLEEAAQSSDSNRRTRCFLAQENLIFKIFKRNTHKPKK
jgi:hypothetical protein